MVNRALDIVLIGPPGAGKGTQGRRLAAAFELLHISIGELLHEEVARGTDIGGEACAYMVSGHLVPDALAGRMLLRWLHSQPGAMGCVFDGYPRNGRQAELLDGLLAELGRRIDAALYLDVPDEVALTRMAAQSVCQGCGRLVSPVNGDVPEVCCATCGGALTPRRDAATARERLRVYRANAGSVVELYRKRGILRTVDGLGDRDAVFGGLRLAVEALLRQ
jgi:adenylate kinase